MSVSSGAHRGANLSGLINGGEWPYTERTGIVNRRLQLESRWVYPPQRRTSPHRLCGECDQRRGVSALRSRRRLSTSRLSDKNWRHHMEALIIIDAQNEFSLQGRRPVPNH